MATYNAPGVFVEEVGFRSKSIEGVSTSTTAFIGPTQQGSDATPTLLTSWQAFEHAHGGLGESNPMAHAAWAFFNEGGRRLYVSSTLAAIEPLQDVSIVAAPGDTTPEMARALIAHVERPGAHGIAVLDAPSGATTEALREHRRQFDSSRAALYAPWVVSTVGGRDVVLPPSGFICGIYARNDVERGAHKAPANEVVRGALRFERDIHKAEHEVLNAESINCLRFFEGRGMRVWGARTLSSDPEWRYVNQRRYFNYLQASLERGTRWVQFEAHIERLWTQVHGSVTDFLYNEWRNGALVGSKPEQSFFVKCDRSTMTQDDIQNGRLVCQVGVAFIKPAEFVSFRVVQKTA